MTATTGDARTQHDAHEASETGKDAEARKDRLLPWIAAERALRCVLLLVVGVVLLTHPHENWVGDITKLTGKLGLDPKENWVQRILRDAAKLRGNTQVVLGTVALGYAGLEGAEAYGLWRRERWGEWLTVVATSLLLIPELWELTKSATPFKVGALVVNLAIVIYLLVRLEVISLPRRRRLGGEQGRRSGEKA